MSKESSPLSAINLKALSQFFLGLSSTGLTMSLLPLTSSSTFSSKPHCFITVSGILIPLDLPMDTMLTLIHVIITLLHVDVNGQWHRRHLYLSRCCIKFLLPVHVIMHGYHHPVGQTYDGTPVYPPLPHAELVGTIGLFNPHPGPLYFHRHCTDAQLPVRVQGQPVNDLVIDLDGDISPLGYHHGDKCRRSGSDNQQGRQQNKIGSRGVLNESLQIQILRFGNF
ncbi:secreted protein [Candidatus Magnetobacterium bavaricum]|uniref:Secreted protein n=1 Tax=Candidatus Magnetobacterium bavaricum TaxID=29290 RepID=A0A0F3GNZ1_9BACT|nr:secreted protein [Candidatus Magnetobacterium bavaricum]